MARKARAESKIAFGPRTAPRTARLWLGPPTLSACPTSPTHCGRRPHTATLSDQVFYPAAQRKFLAAAGRALVQVPPIISIIVGHYTLAEREPRRHFHLGGLFLSSETIATHRPHYQPNEQQQKISTNACPGLTDSALPSETSGL